MTAEREMTLHEWVGKLPEIHRANREFLALQARIAELEQQLAELREAAGELVANAEWDGDISTVDTDDLKALRATLLQEPPHPLPERS